MMHTLAVGLVQSTPCRSERRAPSGRLRRVGPVAAAHESLEGPGSRPSVGIEVLPRRVKLCGAGVVFLCCF